MDAISDPRIWRVTWWKSARVGATKILNATIGYYMDHDPCPIMVVQPTVEDAQGYSREEIAPMLRDCPRLAGLVADKSRVSESTILHKSFPGGSLSMVGANSARGFRRVSRRVVMFDEVDGYPPSAGLEGDQIKLGIKRTEYYHDRKVIAASTPTDEGVSRIAPMFEEGDQRRYHVPCPHCDHMDFLVFRSREDRRGHVMRWPDDQPELAYFECAECGCDIDEVHKFEMLERGEWVAEAEFSGHASFHLWAAYSMAPNATWGTIASEFVEASRKGADALKTVINTTLGETWKPRGEAPSWERLYRRREPYPLGVVPEPVRFLTCGVDVQKDRLVYEVVGWSLDRQSWTIEPGELYGDTADMATWRQLDELLDRPWPTEGGETLQIRKMGVDSGYNTQQVYSWCRTKPISRVIATKGVSEARVLVRSATVVDVTKGGKKIRRGYRVFPIGVDLAKAELYGWLRLEPGIDEPTPPGYCHFPEADAEYFKQLTGEHLVSVRKRNGAKVHEWHVLPGRQNHWLDCRVINRVCAAIMGIDRVKAGTKGAQAPAKAAQRPREARREGRNRPAKGGGGWLQPRRGWLG
jgi:phage terminase large subunit GpA-like protein